MMATEHYIFYMKKAIGQQLLSTLFYIQKDDQTKYHNILGNLDTIGFTIGGNYTQILIPKAAKSDL